MANWVLVCRTGCSSKIWSTPIFSVMPLRRRAAFIGALTRTYPGLDPVYLRALARRQGGCAAQILGSAATPADLGTHFGHTLYACEVDHLIAKEWALTDDDILWRRTKCGLHLAQPQRDTVAAHVAARLARRSPS